MRHRVTWWIFAVIFGLAAPAAAAHGVELTWQPVEGASAYEVEIGADPELLDPLQITVRSTRHVWARLPRRRHYWRVRTVDASGRVGRWSSLHEIPAFHPTPSLQSPPDGTHFEHADGLAIELEFRPGRGMRGMSHEVEVASDETFDEILCSLTTQHSRVSFPVPDPGEYVWRVRPNVRGEKAVSTARRFSVDAPPEPEPEPDPVPPEPQAPGPSVVVEQHVAVPAAPHGVRWHVGAHAGVATNLRLLRAGRFGFDTTFRAPSGWTLVASASELYSSQQFDDVSSTVHLARVWVGGGYTVSVSDLGLAALVGPMGGVLFAEVAGTATGRRVERRAVGGINGTVEVNYRLGPGQLWLSTGLEWGATDLDIVSLGSRRMSTLVGYRLEVRP